MQGFAQGKKNNAETNRMNLYFTKLGELKQVSLNVKIFLPVLRRRNICDICTGPAVDRLEMKITVDTVT